MDSFSPVQARRTLLFSLVCIGMGFTVLFPVLAPLGREIGLTEVQITSIIAASSLTVFLTSPLWGRISDVWGRKRVILVGLFGFSAGTLLFNSVLYAGLSRMFDRHAAVRRTGRRADDARKRHVGVDAGRERLHGRHHRPNDPH